MKQNLGSFNGLDIESDMNELRAICDGKSEGLITILEKN